MRYRVLSFLFLLGSGLFFAHDARALTISGGGASGPLNLSASDRALNDIVATCDKDGEIAGTFELSFTPYLSGLSFTGNTNYTFTYEGDWNGGAFSAPTATDVSDPTTISITKALPTCKVGDRLRFSGLHVKYAGAATNKIASHVYLRSGASAISTAEIIIDTKKPTLKSASYSDSNHDGIIDTINAFFDEPVQYPSYSQSHWLLSSGSIYDLHLTGLQVVSSEVIGFSATAGVRQTGTPGTKSNLMLYPGATVTDEQGNQVNTGNVVDLDDKASPVPYNAFMIDADNDGKFDQVEIDFSEKTNATGMSLSSLANLWSGNGITITGGVTGAIFDSAIRLQVEEPTVMKTSVDGIKIHYTGGTAPLKDTTGNAMVIGDVSNNATDTYPVLNEDVPPRIASVYPVNGATSAPTTGSFSVTFSEPMENVVISFAPNTIPASAVVWSENNTKATWNYTNWSGGTTYTVTVQSAAAKVGSSASKKALSAGAVPNSFAFTTSAVTTPVPTTNITNPSIVVRATSELAGNDALTNSRDVQLSLNVSGATEMQITNGVDFAGAVWVPYTASVSWTLTSGIGTKTVCARFRNASVTTSAVCDNITYDSALEVPNDIQFSIEGNQPSVEDASVTLTIHALSAKWMKISNYSNLFDATWIPYATSKSWMLPSGYGTKTVYIQFKSYDAIESSVYSDSVVYQGATAPGMPATDVAQLQPGDLIQSPEFKAVYYYGSDFKRYTFPNQKVFESWYPNFANVKFVSSEQLASIPLGGNMIVHPGSFLIKSPSLPKVYFVSPGGILHPIKNETVAKKLFGNTWASLVIDMGDAFITNYKFTGNELAEDSLHPDGSIIEAAGKRYYVESGVLHQFNDTGFSLNGFQSRFLIKLSTKPNYSTGVGITSKQDTYSKLKKIQKDGTIVLL